MHIFLHHIIITIFPSFEWIWNILKTIFTAFEWIWNILKLVNPNPSFLSDIAAFEAAIIAFLVPLSIEIISKMSERYNSDIITFSFEKNWENRILPIFLLINIVAAILLRFVVQDNVNSIAWKIAGWIMLIALIFVAYIILRLIKIIKDFMLNPQNIINQLYLDIESFIGKKATISKREKIVASLEGIGDILEFETKKLKNKLVLESLQKINDFLTKTLQNNPDKFEQVFSTALNQIARILDAAICSQNATIGRTAVYNIISLLTVLSSQQNNEQLIEQILWKLREITKIAMQYNNNIAYIAGIYWYTNIVFNAVGNKENFRLEYLNLFDKCFFSIIRLIIFENHTPMFNSLVSSLVNGQFVPDHPKKEIWDYGHYILRKNYDQYKELNEEYGLEKQITKLVNTKIDLQTKEQLTEWLKNFDKLKAIIEQNLNEKEREEVLEIEKEIKNSIISLVKFNNLTKIVFAIGAYCLFKKQYSHIKYLWEYKQPLDADAERIGHDVIPTTLDGVIRLYFSKDQFKYRFEFNEDHHGCKKYYRQYFLLLLTRILQSIPIDTEDKSSQIENYKLPDLHIYRLSDLENSMNECIKLAIDLKTELIMLAEIGIDTLKLDELFDVKLVPFLRKVQKEAKKQISAKHRTGKISQQKIREFQNDVLTGFNESAKLRNIFVLYFKAFEDKSKEITLDRQERFGINSLLDKGTFFDEWYVNYLSPGKMLGRGFAASEDSYLLNKIAKQCKKITEENFDTTLLSFENSDDIVIFTTPNAIWKFFENSENFKHECDINTNQLKIKELKGYYSINGKSIPVFGTFNQKTDNQILILNKSKIGKLIQLSPLNTEENENNIEGIFYMDIQAFSDNENLIQEILKNPSEKLLEIEDEQKQRKYLQERVLIKIIERFKYCSPEDFEGYELLLKID